MHDHETVARELLAAIQKARAGFAATSYTIPTVFGGPHHGLEVPGSLIGTLGKHEPRRRISLPIRRPVPKTRPTSAGQAVNRAECVADYEVHQFRAGPGLNLFAAYLHRPDGDSICDAVWKLAPEQDWT